MSPIIPGILEVTAWCLYDQVALPVESQPYETVRQFFVIPVGQLSYSPELQTKYFLHTNMVQAATLPAPQRLVARRLNALFFQDDKPLRLDQTPLYARTQIDFDINRKNYWTSPAWLCASPFALFGTPKDELPRLKENYGIEWERVAGALMSNPGKEGDERVDGVYIGVQDMFQVTARIQSEIPAGTKLAIHIDGPLVRSIQ